MLIRLDRNKDVAKELGKIKKHQVLVGFAAETNDLLDNASAKIIDAAFPRSGVNIEPAK